MTSLPDSYELNTKQYREAAERTGDPVHRLIMLQMVRAWLEAAALRSDEAIAPNYGAFLARNLDEAAVASPAHNILCCEARVPVRCAASRARTWRSPRCEHAARNHRAPRTTKDSGGSQRLRPGSTADSATGGADEQPLATTGL
jgi:hypothetical protein